MANFVSLNQLQIQIRLVLLVLTDTKIRYHYGKMANFESPNQMQIQILLVLLVRPDTCDDTSQPCPFLINITNCLDVSLADYFICALACYVTPAHFYRWRRRKVHMSLMTIGGGREDKANNLWLQGSLGKMTPLAFGKSVIFTNCHNIHDKAMWEDLIFYPPEGLARHA